MAFGPVSGDEPSKPGDPAPQGAGLSTVPVPSNGRISASIVAAFSVPAALVALASLRDLKNAAGAPASTGITLCLALGWLVLVPLPPVRRTLVDLGRILLARLSFPFLFVATFVLLLVAVSRPTDASVTALAAGVAISCLASAFVALERSRKRFFMTLIVFAFNGLLLVGIEAYVRVFELPHKAHNRVLAEYDPLLGWKLRAGMSVDRTNVSYTAHETIGELGFRTKTRPFEKPAGVRRVVALGDSFTEGYTVNDGETWPEVLEKSLAPTGPTEAISLGVGGYSTDQEVLAYVQHGRRFHPDVVLLQFCPNDVPFNILDDYGHRGNKPVFVRFGEDLFLEGVPVPDRKTSGLLSHDLQKLSAVAMILDDVIAGLALKHELKTKVDMDEAWHVTDLLYRDLDRLVRSDGARLAVFNSNPAGAFENMACKDIDQRLRAILASRSIPYIDTSPAFTDVFDTYVVPDDGHWNKKGHDAIGRFLAGRVQELGLLAAPTK